MYLLLGRSHILYAVIYENRMSVSILRTWCMYIKYLFVSKSTQMGSYRKQSYFCPAFGLVVFFISNVIHKNSRGVDFATPRAVCIVCSFPQLPLGSLAVCFPLGATVAAVTGPGRRATLPELQAHSALYGHGVQLMFSSPW